jgi:hypothetical protein
VRAGAKAFRTRLTPLQLRDSGRRERPKVVKGRQQRKICGASLHDLQPADEDYRVEVAREDVSIGYRNAMTALT